MHVVRILVLKNERLRTNCCMCERQKSNSVMQQYTDLFKCKSSLETCQPTLLWNLHIPMGCATTTVDITIRSNGGFCRKTPLMQCALFVFWIRRKSNLTKWTRNVISCYPLTDVFSADQSSENRIVYMKRGNFMLWVLSNLNDFLVFSSISPTS